MTYKIFFSNIGYAKGIDGTLAQHLARIARHIRCGRPLQEDVLAQLRAILMQEEPDLCCLVEIDNGSFQSASFSQIAHIATEPYLFHDVADKYGPGNWIGGMPLHRGRCNAFLSKDRLSFERLYFANGSKRLIYKIVLPEDATGHPGGITLFFAHFSLMPAVRQRQFEELRSHISVCPGPVVVMADFNILQGFRELEPLLRGSDLIVLNDEAEPTFTFHTYRLALDLCVCTAELAERLDLKIIPQPFSDHAGLLLEIKD